MGHTTYQNMLEDAFREHFPDVDFHSIRLFDRMGSSLFLRTILRVVRIGVPGLGARDAFFMRFRLESGISLIAWLLIVQALRTRRFDVIHIHTQSIAFLAPYLPTKLPYVISHDYTTALYQKDRPDLSPRALAPIVRMERAAFQRAAHVISWTERARQSLIADYGVDPHKAATIPPGSPFPFRDSAKAAHIPTERVRILFVGNDFKRKGGYDVLSVFQRDFAGTCRLDIVSNEPIEMAPNRYVFVHKGLAPNSEPLRELYGQADIFVLPTYEDCFALVFIEAMAAGLPCVGTNVMAVPEIIEEGKTGYTVPPGDLEALSAALASLVRDPELRRSMGRQALASAAAKFDRQHNTGRIVDILRRCAAPSTPSV